MTVSRQPWQGWPRPTGRPNKVTQKEYMCPLHGPCQYTNPIKTAYAYTHLQYDLWHM
jgi:hypothetical protein